MSEERPAVLEEKFVENVFRIFDHMPIGINFVDENGKVIRLNKAMLDYFKFTHDVEGKHICEIDTRPYDSPSDVHRISCYDARKIKNTTIFNSSTAIIRITTYGTRRCIDTIVND